MESVRFEKFTLLIGGIHKCIHKMKIDTVSEFGIKSVHVFWLYQLLRHPEGLTSAEIAAGSMVDRSLVCRELEMLRKSGFIDIENSDAGKKRVYNARITLTERGIDLASRIADEVVKVQEIADAGITAEELEIFYSTLEKLHRNFVALTTPTGKRNI